LGLILAVSGAGLGAQQQQQQQQQQPPSPAGRGAAPPGGLVQTGPGRGRPAPPQPQQKQSVEYFLGSWAFDWTGRESPVTTGPRSGVLTFARRGDTPVLEMRAEGKSDDTGAAFTETGTAEWNGAQKTWTFTERLGSGVEVVGVGDWSSPLAIRYESQNVRVGNQSVRIRRTYMILSAGSFTVAEEISIDGGPFQRLGNGRYSKAASGAR
jgi:hypothetical protein